MSENIPESVPTSADPRSHRPLKRRALSPTSKQAAHLDALFANPTKEILLPSDLQKQRSTIGAPPEIVANVQGSSAGAGSGEFHVYKASRRREYERLRAMDEEKEAEEADKKFESEQDRRKREDEERTGRNRVKREKARLRAMRKKGGMKGGDVEGVQKPKFKPDVHADTSNGAVGKEGEDAAEVRNPEEIGIIIHDED
ncbi:hypothetical protein BDV97DRAFT_296480 [Delphinella strobiligena]|nr:hypothetical protein BDV97DRAFT_296480 [Delphinella strobiligena]